MSDVNAPAAPGDRSVLIDTLRAVALFGVIMMNIMAMLMFYKAPQVIQAAGPADYAAALFELVFLQGKARSAFAFLFGLGFGVMMQRLEARGTAFAPFYLRRMTILLLIGLINLTFLFWGDILIVYALLGMVLILFRGLSQKALLATGLALVFIPPVVGGLLDAMAGPVHGLAGWSSADLQARFDALAPAYLGSDFLAYVRANFAYYGLHNLGETPYAVVYNLGVLGLFVLGVWTARKGVLTAVDAHRPLLRRIALVALPLGLIISAVQATRRLGIEMDGPLYGLVTASYLGLPLMAFGYIAILALWISRGGAWLTRLLSPMGRMALTGYLASNGIGSFLWYGWGLGLMKRPEFQSVMVNFGIGLGIFVGLCVFSALWLSVFRFGPAEWVWRSLTYGRPQPMRKG